MTVLPNFPLVSQRTTITSDGRVSEDALYLCVPASIGAVMLWLEGKSQWDSTINPDLLKDKAYGESYTGGTSASAYVQVVKSMGFALSSIDMPDSASTVATAHMLLKQNEPAIFTELDPYVDTSLDAYKDWTHVCVFVGADAGGLVAMDPFIAQLVYKSDATWANLLRANQLWTVEKIMSLPQGWVYEGTTLHSPGADLVLGFATYVYQRLLKGAWEADDYPDKPQFYAPRLEASNPDLGDGDQVITKKHVLGYPHNPVGAVAHLKNTVIEEYVGTELAYTRNQYASLYAAYQKLQAAPAPTQVAPPVDPRVAQYAAKLAAVNLLLTQALAQATT